MIPKSLRGRVTVIGVVTLALVLGIGAWVTVRALAAALRSDTNAQNEEVLDDLAEAILDGADVGSLLLPIGADGTDFVILDDEGATVNASLFGFADSSIVLFEDAVPFPVGEGEDISSFSDQELDDLLNAGLLPPDLVELLTASTTEVIGVEFPDAYFVDADDWFETRRVIDSPSDGELTLVALSPIGVVDRSIDRLQWTLALIVPLLVALGGWALWAALGAALRPVREIAEEAERIAPSTSGDRLPVPDSGDEIAELTVTLNGMLDRLDAGLVRQRQFVSDASHELRSPLTAVKGAAGLVAASPDLPADILPSVDALQSGAARLEATLDDLTHLADGGGSVVRSEFDLADLIEAEVTLVRSADPHVAIDTTAVVAGVAEANPVQLARAVHNLLANAVAHADRTVEITATPVDGGVEVVVDDDGPGVPAPDRERIFERFVRLDESRDRQQGGSGLGLALVASIAEAHGGSVTCTQSPLGGARFTLRC